MALGPCGTVDERKSVFVLVCDALVGSFKMFKETGVAGICVTKSLFRRSSDVIISPKVFPLLQCDRHVAVFPKEIMEGAEVEFVALLHARVGKKFQNL